MEYTVVKSACEYPHVRESKTSVKILDTHTNLEWLLAHFDAQIRFNLMTRQREVFIPGIPISNEDKENSAINWVMHIATLNLLPTRNIDHHLDTIALQYTYHPIREALVRKPWDGVNRLDQFIDTIEAEDQELARKIIKTWMRAAIAAAYSDDGFVNHGVLVLQGKQSIGKTTWIKRLDPIGCHAVKEGVFLDPSNKDSVSQIAQYWIVEFGEVETIFKKSEVGRLKSYITMESDYVRLPYARKPTRLPRRTVYAATVNDINYLTDDTGNRRWWTIPCISINNDHGLDMLQVWAEVYHDWQQGGLTYLPSDLQEKMNLKNKEHERIDPLYEKLLGFYDWSHPITKSMTATAILEDMGIVNPKPQDVKRMGSILREVTAVAKGRKSNGLLVYDVPSRRNLVNSV